jgi:hypothetical protein
MHARVVIKYGILISRWVGLHIQLPENLENYYQEAGRPEETVKVLCFTN